MGLEAMFLVIWGWIRRNEVVVGQDENEGAGLGRGEHRLFVNMDGKMLAGGKGE